MLKYQKMKSHVRQGSHSKIMSGEFQFKKNAKFCNENTVELRGVSAKDAEE